MRWAVMSTQQSHQLALIRHLLPPPSRPTVPQAGSRAMTLGSPSSTCAAQSLLVLWGRAGPHPPLSGKQDCLPGKFRLWTDPSPDSRQSWPEQAPRAWGCWEILCSGKMPRASPSCAHSILQFTDFPTTVIWLSLCAGSPISWSHPLPQGAPSAGAPSPFRFLGREGFLALAGP